MNAFAAACFHDETAARQAFETILWPTGPVCHRCGESKRHYSTSRPGRYRCGNPGCRKDFTVTTGTVMERSHIKLQKWLMGFYLMASSKKGVSSHQLHRSLGITYEAAWFMSHRIREAMRSGESTEPMLRQHLKEVRAALQDAYRLRLDLPKRPLARRQEPKRQSPSKAKAQDPQNLDTRRKLPARPQPSQT